MAMLDVTNLGISFGGLRAVDAFEVHIEKGELYGLIGPNGAGKTTVFNMLTGVYKPTDGVIKLDEVNLPARSGYSFYGWDVFDVSKSSNTTCWPITCAST